MCRHVVEISPTIRLNVVNIPDEPLVPFSMNTDGNLLKQDMTQEYVFEDDSFDKSSTQTTTKSDVYYQITGDNAYGEDKADRTESTLTCCGNRLTTTTERLLDWLAAVGGFAGLIHAFFFWLSGQEFTGCGSETDQENEVGQWVKATFVSCFFLRFFWGSSLIFLMTFVLSLYCLLGQRQR